MAILGKKNVRIIRGKSFDRNERLEMKTMAYKGFRTKKNCQEKATGKVEKFC